MRVAEIYASKQGEGLLTGRPSVFVRFSGCNLRCDFCDTPFASWDPEGDALSVDGIVDEVRRLEQPNVVITGGEPMIFRQLPDLCQQLAQLSLHITIETAGTVWLNLDCDLISISPKMSNSTPDVERAGAWAKRHEQTRINPQVVRQLVDHYPYQLKFVVDVPDDLAEIEAYLGQWDDLQPDRILMMPQGTTVEELDARAAWLKTYCETQGFRFCDRMHIRWYGHQRGT